MKRISKRASREQPIKPQSTDSRNGLKQLTTRKNSIERESDINVFLSLNEAMAKFLKIKKAKNLKAKTIAGYAKELRYFSDWLTSTYVEMSVKDITIDILREYVVWKRDDKALYGGHPYKEAHQGGAKGVKASSVNVGIRVLKTFFSELTEEGLLKDNPSRNMSLMRQEEDTVTPLTDGELKRFLKAPDQRQFAQFRDYVMMMVILDTGIRLNEICSLEKSDVDLNLKQLTILPEKSKNRKARHIPLSMPTVRLLKTLIQEVETHFDTKFVFTTNYGTPFNEKGVQSSFNKYREKAGLKRTVSPHVLRHNFATMAAHSGMSIFHLQKILGHSDIQTTRKYVQLDDEDIKEQHTMHSPIARLLKKNVSDEKNQ